MTRETLPPLNLILPELKDRSWVDHPEVGQSTGLLRSQRIYMMMEDL